jgi:N-acetylglutamate synthase-like GNAT family acetyltransferase
MIRKGVARDRVECLSLATAMPEHFNMKGLMDMEKDLRECPFYVSAVGHDVQGFVAVKSDTEEGVTEILWIAVRSDHQRKGIGTALVERIMHDSKTQGVKVLRVRTRTASSSYSPYEKTRRFYEKLGFNLVRAMDHRLWDPGNPSAVYEKPVSPAH